jgi:hypothetical protein
MQNGIGHEAPKTKSALNEPVTMTTPTVTENVIQEETPQFTEFVAEDIEPEVVPVAGLEQPPNELKDKGSDFLQLLLVSTFFLSKQI